MNAPSCAIENLSIWQNAIAGGAKFFKFSNEITRPRLVRDAHCGKIVLAQNSSSDYYSGTP
jgi:hypothetical protein